MKKKIKYPIIAIIAIVSFSLLLYFSYFTFIFNDYTREPEQSTIPFGYYQGLDLNDSYIYMVSQFGNSSTWEPFPNTDDQNNPPWSANVGGQIRVNFTGFSTPTEGLKPYNILPGTKIPYIDVEILKNESSLLTSNKSIQSISNIEASHNLFIGCNEFKSGFIIPYMNMTYIKNIASTSVHSGSVEIEETYNFIFIGYTQTNTQNSRGDLTTYMTYDKKTGLLVRFFTQYDEFKLNMSLANYSFEPYQEFDYNVMEWESSLNITNWYKNNSYGTVYSNPSGQVAIEPTNYYNKSIHDSSVFEGPVLHLNVSFIENNTWGNYERGVLIENASVSNISNTELAHAMSLGYHHFDSGFFLNTENLTNLKSLAREQNHSIGWGAYINIKETNLTIQFNFRKEDLTQNITLIYDKWTGLLQYASLNDSSNPDIELKIIDFNPLIAIENLTLIVDYNEDIKIWANFSLIIGHTTVYDALKKWCNVSYDDYGGMGYLITEIDGEGGNWLYSINSEYVGAAANKVNLKSNDKIRWYHGDI